MQSNIPPEIAQSVADLLDTLAVRVVLDRETIYYADDPTMEHNTLLIHRDQPMQPAFFKLHPEHVPTFREMLQPEQRLVHLRDWRAVVSRTEAVSTE